MPACFKQCPALRQYVSELRCHEARRLFITQTVSAEPGTKRCKARCPCCGKTYHKRLWRMSREDEMFTSLQRHFEYCQHCGKWVCKDCYCVITDKTGEEMCRQCAEASGAEGMNGKQYDIYLRRRPKRPRTEDEADEDMLELARYVDKRQKETDALLEFFKDVDLRRPIDFSRTGSDPPAEDGGDTTHTTII
jgi:hypothetical protein